MRKPNYPVILFIIILIVVSVASFYIKITVPYENAKDFWLDWDVPSFLLNIFLSGIVLVGITLPQYRQEKYKERVDDFKKVSDELATDSNRYSIEALNAYRKRYEDEAFVKEDGYLLYKEGWMPSKDKNNMRLFYLDGEISGEEKNIAAGQDNILVKVESSYQSRGVNRNRKHPDMDEGYAENVKFFTNRNIYNGWMYGLKKLTFIGEKPCFNILEGHYYDYYNTCEYLSYESAYVERILGKKINHWNEYYMTERFSEENLFEPERRFAGIGISTITLLTGVNAKKTDDSGETYFLLHKRSANVAQGMNNYHVIPAGGYEPVKPISLVDPKKKGNENEDQKIGEIKPMLDSVLREFGEELLGYEEYFDLSNSDLLEGLKGVIKPIFLGAGFEPLNTMLDVLAAIVINVMNMPEVNGMPLFPKLEGGKLTKDSAITESQLEEVLNTNSNFEGEITLIPFEASRLKQYEMDMRSTAGMRQFMKILQYDNVRKALEVKYNDEKDEEQKN